MIKLESIPCVFPARVLTGAVFLFLTACQTGPYQPQARDVKKRPGKEGVIALKLSHRPEDRTLAEQMMGKNCAGKKVNVLEEGEIVVGEKTKSSGTQAFNAGEGPQSAGNLFGMPISTSSRPSSETSSETEKVQIKEWQITYECESGKNSVKR